MDLHRPLNRGHHSVVNTMNLRYTVHNKWGVMAGFEFLVDAQVYLKTLTCKWSMWDNDNGKLVRSNEVQALKHLH